MGTTTHRRRVTLIAAIAVVLILAWGGSASAAPGDGAVGDLGYKCPYTKAEVTAAFDVTQLDDRNKGDGTATISTDHGSFTVKVKLARVDADTGTAYFAGPTSESKYAGWWYFAVRAGEAGTGGAYGRYVFGPSCGLKADWILDGYIGGFGDFQPLTAGSVTITG